MSKLLILIYSAFLIAVSYLSAHQPHHEINWFMSASPMWDNLRVGLAIILLVYSLSHYFRPWPVKFTIGVGALLMIAIGSVGITQDSFLGLFSLDLRPIDVFILVEGGILALVASLDYYQLPDLEPVVLPEPTPTVSLFFLGNHASAAHAYRYAS